MTYLQEVSSSSPMGPRACIFWVEMPISADAAAAERFGRGVDSAAVYLNCSTRFTDGGEFGLGAEIGISTQKMHARGPMGLEELTSCKYVIYGEGQVR